MLFREMVSPKYRSFPFLCSINLTEKDGLVVLHVNWPIQTYCHDATPAYDLELDDKGEVMSVGTSHRGEDHKIQMVAHHMTQLSMCPGCWDRMLREVVGQLLTNKLDPRSRKVWCCCGMSSHALTTGAEAENQAQLGQKEVPALPAPKED